MKEHAINQKLKNTNAGNVFCICRKFDLATALFCNQGYDK